MTEVIEKHPTFQGLMDSTYDRYKANRSEKWEKDAILEQCRGDEVLAVPLGNLNYQVENGGFMQWIGNEYATELAVSSIKVALRMIGTPVAFQVLDLIHRAEHIGLEEPRYCYDDEDDEFTSWRDALHELDMEYYDLNADLMDDAEAFFVRRKS